MMWSSSLAMGRQILVSSAYSAMSVPAFRLEGRSLMKRTKRIGPRIEPCRSAFFGPASSCHVMCDLWLLFGHA